MKSFKNLFFLLNIIYNSNVVLGQTAIKLVGKVQEAVTGEPISSVHIEDCFGNGVVTDINGEFELQLNDCDFFFLSHIGYLNDTIYAKNAFSSDYLVLELKFDTKQLNEIIIRPSKNPALTLIENVISNVQNNYSSTCYSTRSLYRELLITSTPANTPMYLTEGITYDIFKNNKAFEKNTQLNYYRKSLNDNYNRYPRLNLKGTTDIPIRYNIVNSYSGPLNPRTFNKNYTFTITDTLSLDESVFYKVIYISRKSRGESGHLLIDRDNYAVSEIFLESSRDTSNNSESSKNYKKKSFSVFCKYEKFDSIYYLNSIKVIQDYEKINNAEVSSQGYYQVLNIDYCSANETYLEENIHFNDIFLEIDGADLSWVSDSMEVVNEYDYLFKNQRISSNKRLKSRFRLGYRLPLWVSSSATSNLLFDNDLLSITDTISGIQEFNTSIATVIGFELTDNLIMEFEGFNSFKRSKFVGIYLNFLYEDALPKSRISYSIGTKFGLLKQRIYIGTFSFTPATSINGKIFDSGELEAFLEERSYQFNPMFLLGYVVNNTTTIQFGGALFMNWSSKNGVYVKENDTFFRRKSDFFEYNPDVNTKTVYKNSFPIFISINWHLH